MRGGPVWGRPPVHFDPCCPPVRAVCIPFKIENRRSKRDTGTHGQVGHAGRLPKPIQNRHLPVAGAQVLGQQMQVALGRGDLRMPEHHRQAHDVATMPEVVRSERVAEAVPAEARQLQLRLQQVEGRATVAFLPPTATERPEHEVVADALLCLQLLEPIQALSHLRRERHEPFLLSFAEHLEDQIGGVHIVVAETQGLRDP